MFKVDTESFELAFAEMHAFSEIANFGSFEVGMSLVTSFAIEIELVLGSQDLHGW